MNDTGSTRRDWLRSTAAWGLSGAVVSGGVTRALSADDETVLDVGSRTQLTWDNRVWNVFDVNRNTTRCLKQDGPKASENIVNVAPVTREPFCTDNPFNTDDFRFRRFDDSKPPRCVGPRRDLHVQEVTLFIRCGDQL